MNGTTLPGAAPQQPLQRLPQRTRLDWSGVRAGFLEVFLTLAATVGFGFAWAAVELVRLGPPPASQAPGSEVGPITAAAFETGYPAALPSGR